MLAVWCSRAQSSGASKRVARWSSAKETCDLPAAKETCVTTKADKMWKLVTETD